MSAITIEHVLLQRAEGRVVLACNEHHGAMLLGVTGGGVFVQIDRVTMLELERGEIDFRTALAERCAGIVVRD